MATKELRLSPSAVNTYFRCPRLFYYNYILKTRAPPNIHLYKGNFVHKILEHVFDSTKWVDIKEYAHHQMLTWKPNNKWLKDEKDAEHHRLEAEKILEMFANRVNEKIDMILLEGKAKSKNHAWNLVRPRLRECKIHDKTLNVVGIIDSVETSFDEMVYVIDYKTSKLYRHTIPQEYIRQISIYAYLYNQEHGKLPDYVGIHYLRYGEVFIIPVTEELVEEAVEDIKFVREKSKSISKDDYPRCSQKWCDCNYFEGDKNDS